MDEHAFAVTRTTNHGGEIDPWGRPRRFDASARSYGGILVRSARSTPLNSAFDDEPDDLDGLQLDDARIES